MSGAGYKNSDLVADSGSSGSAPVPFFFDEIWRARFKAISPVNPVFHFYTFDLQGGAENADDSTWRMRNGATRTLNKPMSIHCLGAGQDVAKAYTAATGEVHQTSWYLAGAGYWMNAAIIDATDRRGFSLMTPSQTQYVSAGVHGAASLTKFSFAAKGGSGPAAGNLLVPSTITYAAGFHTTELLYTVSGPNSAVGVLQGSIDGEPWLTLTTDSLDIPAAALAQDHGVWDGTGEMYVTLSAVGASL